MCQFRVVTVDNGQEELIQEDVTTLEVKGENICLASLFDGKKELKGQIDKIDFTGGKVFLLTKS